MYLDPKMASSLLESVERPRFAGLTTLRLLRAGGQAWLYAAVGPDGPVSVKRWGPGAAAAARRELEALRRLAPHRYVARFVGTARSLDDPPDAPPCAVLEAPAGATLARRLEEGGALPASDVAALGVALADALGHLHAHGLVHADLQPAGVALRDPGGEPVLLDLGAVADASAAAPVGSPAYMAPEQVVDPAGPCGAAPLAIGPAIDVYLLGGTLFEAATGRPPWSAEDGPHAPWSRPDDRWDEGPASQVPPALRRVIDRCLAGAPANRYATPAQVADDLRRLL